MSRRRRGGDVGGGEDVWLGQGVMGGGGDVWLGQGEVGHGEVGQ